VGERLAQLAQEIDYEPLVLDAVSIVGGTIKIWESQACVKRLACCRPFRGEVEQERTYPFGILSRGGTDRAARCSPSPAGPIFDPQLFGLSPGWGGPRRTCPRRRRACTRGSPRAASCGTRQSPPPPAEVRLPYPCYCPVLLPS
jgi:hypothetical protein